MRARPRPEIGYWLLCAALSVALLIPIAALLFWLVDVRAVHLAIPYALLATSFVAPPLRR